MRQRSRVRRVVSGQTMHENEVAGSKRHARRFLSRGCERAELERRLGHANDRYLRLYTNPPDDIAAGYVEDL